MLATLEPKSNGHHRKTNTNKEPNTSCSISPINQSLVLLLVKVPNETTRSKQPWDKKSSAIEMFHRLGRACFYKMKSLEYIGLQGSQRKWIYVDTCAEIVRAGDLP